MIARNIGAILSLLLLSSFLALLLIRPSPQLTDGTAKTAATSRSHPSTANTGDLLPSRNDSARNQLFRSKHSSGMTAIRRMQSLPLSPTESVAALKQLLNNAALGDVESRVMVFQALDWCSNKKAEFLAMQIAEFYAGKVSEVMADSTRAAVNTCRDLPLESPPNRFNYLETAALTGDPRAMVFYAKGFSNLPRNEPSWVLANADEIPLMKLKALTFLEQAASMGYVEAINELADVFSTGRFGIKDQDQARLLRANSAQFQDNRLGN